MVLKKISAEVTSISAIDWNRKIFDGLIPLPNGTSYNCYIIKGKEKTVLIDTIDPSMAQVLDEITDPIDFIVSNHSEQDHSGCIPKALEKWPNAKVIATPKGIETLKDLMNIPDNKFMAVENNFELDIGGKTLKFIHMPWVHWPETMVSYLKEDKMLFSCDLFGSHIATNDVYSGESQYFIDFAKMYYAEIMMPYRAIIKKHLQIIPEVNMILPSHGPIHDKPKVILDKYDDWVNGIVNSKVVVVYVSMHGSTKLMVDHLVQALVSKGVPVDEYDLVSADLGKLATSIVDAATIVIGTSVILGGPHPHVVAAAYLVNALNPKTRHAAIIGSYGWAQSLESQISASISKLKVELFPSVICKGIPRTEQFVALENLATEIARVHAANGYSR